MGKVYADIIITDEDYGFTKNITMYSFDWHRGRNTYSIEDAEQLLNKFMVNVEKLQDALMSIDRGNR